MRELHISITARQQFIVLLDQGRVHYSDATIVDKADLVLAAIEKLQLSDLDLLQPTDPDRGLNLITVRKTPFVLAYSLSNDALHVYFIFHRHQNRMIWDISDAEW